MRRKDDWKFKIYLGRCIKKHSRFYANVYLRLDNKFESNGSLEIFSSDNMKEEHEEKITWAENRISKIERFYFATRLFENVWLLTGSALDGHDFLSRMSRNSNRKKVFRRDKKNLAR